MHNNTLLGRTGDILRHGLHTNIGEDKGNRQLIIDSQ